MIHKILRFDVIGLFPTGERSLIAVTISIKMRRFFVDRLQKSHSFAGEFKAAKSERTIHEVSDSFDAVLLALHLGATLTITQTELTFSVSNLRRN